MLRVNFRLNGIDYSVQKDRNTGNVRITGGDSDDLHADTRRAVLAVGVGLGEKMLKFFADKDRAKSAAAAQ